MASASTSFNMPYASSSSSPPSSLTCPSLLDCLQALNNTGDALKAAMDEARLALNQVTETTKSAVVAAEEYRHRPVCQLGYETMRVSAPDYNPQLHLGNQRQTTRQCHATLKSPSLLPAHPPPSPLTPAPSRSVRPRPHATLQHTLSCPSPTYTKSVDSTASPLYSSEGRGGDGGASANSFGGATTSSVNQSLNTPSTSPSTPSSSSPSTATIESVGGGVIGHSPNYGEVGWHNFTLGAGI